MYSVQHVLWRGAMALSLLVVGGVGAGVSPPVVAEQDEGACQEEAAYVFRQVQSSVKAQVAVQVKPLPMTTFDVVVIQATHDENATPEEA